MPRKTYSRGGYSVTIEHDGSILVKPGDWLSKYSMAIHGDYTHLKEYLRLRDGVFFQINEVDQISAGETIYHRPSMPRGENRPVTEPVPGGQLPPTGPTASEIEAALRRMGLKPTDRGWDTLFATGLKMGVKGLGFIGAFASEIPVVGAIAGGAGTAGAFAVPIVAILGGIYAFNKSMKTGYVQTGMRGVTYGAVAWVFNEGQPKLPKAIEDSVRNNAAMYNPDAEVQTYKSYWNRSVVKSQNALNSYFQGADIPLKEIKEVRKLECYRYADTVDKKWLAAGLLVEAAESYWGTNNKVSFLQPWSYYPNDKYAGRPSYPSKINAHYPY